MPFSPEENPPGMALSTPLNSALVRPRLECCVLFLGSPAQERQWHTGANPGQWHQEVQRAGAPSIQGKAARGVCSAWRRDAPRLQKKTFPSKGHREMVTQQWTEQQPLQIPGSYQEKAFHSGYRSVIGTGPLHPWRYTHISPQQCPDQSDVIWHWIWC